MVGCEDEDNNPGLDGGLPPVDASLPIDAGCAVDTSYNPQINPAMFSSTVDNHTMPLKPGTVMTYNMPGQTVVVTVTTEVKTVDGVDCAVVHTVTTNPDTGDMLADTSDYYAQADDGTVWYFGRDTTSYQDGGSSTAGSWQAGVDGAKPGIMMQAQPAVGNSYRQNYAACQVEDMGEVTALDATASVPAGDYGGCVQTHDTSAVDSSVNQEKTYCPHTGLVLVVDVTTQVRLELSKIQTP